MPRRDRRTRWPYSRVTPGSPARASDPASALDSCGSILVNTGPAASRTFAAGSFQETPSKGAAPAGNRMVRYKSSEGAGLKCLGESVRAVLERADSPGLPPRVGAVGREAIPIWSTSSIQRRSKRVLGINVASKTKRSSGSIWSRQRKGDGGLPDLLSL